MMVDHSNQTLTKSELRIMRRAIRGAVQSQEDQASLKVLLQRGALIRINSSYQVTPEGKLAIRRACLAKEERAFVAQHQEQCYQKQEKNKSNDRLACGDTCLDKVRVNLSESPLASLAKKKRADGSPLLSSSQIEAGERLRNDFERGQLSPLMGINWERLGQAGGSAKSKGGAGRHEISESASVARQKFQTALDYVGDELSGILIDFCCFLKGLEKIEKERQWPARSAKQILSLALARLARHYGLSDVAEGPLHSVMRHWGAENYRPNL